MLNELEFHYTVFIIDDCERSRTQYRNFLQQDSQYQYQVIEAGVSNQSFIVLQQALPDVILLSASSRYLDNILEILSYLKLQNDQLNIPVILLTEQEDDALISEATRRGAYDCLGKATLTAATLRRTIRTVIDRFLLMRQLEQSREEQRLIWDIALRIRQSLNLQEVLQAVVYEVRQLLKADRVVVLRFAANMRGKIVAEAMLPEWTSTLDVQIEDTCFRENAGSAYRYGNKRAIDNIYQAGLSQCHINLLERLQVKANLIVPILLFEGIDTPNFQSFEGNKSHLWGLLIAHQCSAPRQWQPSELNLLDQLAGQISIAIQQATVLEQAQEDIRERQRAEIALEKREQLLAALVKVQRRLLDIEPDENIYEKVLELLGTSSGASSVSIFEKQETALQPEVILQQAKWVLQKNKIEVPSPGASELLAQELPDDWLSVLETGGIVVTPDCDFSDSEQSILNIQNYAAVVLVPLMVHGNFFGFVRFEQCQPAQAWETLEIDFMKASVVAVSLALEQKWAASALGESRRQYAALAAAAPVGIFRTNAKGHCLYVNERYCKISGMLAQEALGLGWSRAVHPDDRNRVFATWYEATQKQLPFSAEYRFQRTNGSIVWVSGQAVIEQDEQGNVIGYIGTISDITNCKEAEQALQNLNVDLEQRVEQRTFELTQSNHQLTEEIAERQKTETALNLQIERLNKMYHLALSINRASTIEDIYTAALNGVRQILKTSYAAILIPDEHGIPKYRASIGISEEYKAAIEEYLQCARQQINSKTVIISDTNSEAGIDTLDSMREVEGIKASASFPLRYQGEHLGKIVVYYDTPHQFTAEEIKLAKTITTYIATAITRKQGEKALQQTNERLAVTNAELAQVTHLKDEFLASMSHELRTPLNAILGMSEGLLDEIYGPLNERQRKSLSVIERSGKHLLELINDILDLAKIESGMLDIQVSSSAVKNLCDSSLSFVRQLASTKNIQITTHIPNDVGEIQVDDRRMRQALINLLSNAVKFTGEGGQVALEVKPEPETQSICFSVVDTGIGISPENIKKLFQSFVQIDSSLNRQYSGTGLGLALVKRIVELHNGSIGVESEIGRGSRFTIRLPLKVAVASPAPVKQSAADFDFVSLTPSILLSGAPLILIAEDNEENTAVFSDFLSNQGYQLVIAKDGFQAVEFAKSYHPQLILMDIQMPGMDGLTAIDHIRKETALAKVPIVALTALAMPGDREKCLATGATQYMTKPVKLKDLVQVVQQLVIH